MTLVLECSRCFRAREGAYDRSNPPGVCSCGGRLWNVVASVEPIAKRVNFACNKCGAPMCISHVGMGIIIAEIDRLRAVLSMHGVDPDTKKPAMAGA